MGADQASLEAIKVAKKGVGSAWAKINAAGSWDLWEARVEQNNWLDWEQWVESSVFKGCKSRSISNEAFRKDANLRELSVLNGKLALL